jgi:hypothetical protein
VFKMTCRRMRLHATLPRNPNTFMKSTCSGILLAATLLAGFTVHADDSDSLRGKWVAKKTNEEGQKFTQSIEVKKDKFTFQVQDGDNNLLLYAEGSVKFDKSGPFNSARFFNIRGGSSATDLNDVDDERTVIYLIDGDTWTVAANFDKERDQKPSVDVYHRAKEGAGATKTLVIDAIEMADTPQTAIWFLCLDANVGEKKARHYKADKGYEKNQVTIPLGMELAGVSPGQKCSFKVQLDDIDEDTCTDEMDNRSIGEFTVSDQGSQTYKPESNWRYTIRWHLK